MEPRELASRAEREPQVPPGNNERYAGYGIFGVAFESGHILAMRRFTASSLGAGYTSLWHRDPGGSWTITTDGDPTLACPRYFGAELDAAPRALIAITWTGPRAFRVEIRDTLRWDLELRPTLATRMLNGMGRLMPDALWRSPAVLGMMARMAGPMLGAGKLTLVGKTSNGQGFLANPLLTWRVAKSQATWKGRDLGRVVPLDEQPSLGQFKIPRAPLFAAGRTYFDAYDPTLHTRGTTREGPPVGGRARAGVIER
ncbi:MAG TPA: hypothetical protein VM370_01125 [Candidatus Thermoplasmatota archaeon]|nr:hypothetical protein [Candidatus Thermoplasmatota archaeon]